MAKANDVMIEGKAGKLSVRTKGLEDNPQQVILLVQGANLSGQLAYDLTFDGRPDYSLMELLGAKGYATVTFSIRGYRDSELNDHPHNVQTEQAMEDTLSVLDWLAGQGYAKPHILGWSWGGRIVGRLLETLGDGVDRAILMDAALGGGQKIPFPGKEEWWLNTAAYFRDRLELEFMESEAHEALAVQAERDELKAPNGIRVENEKGSIPPKPELIPHPVLMLYGFAAGKQNYMQGGIQRADFFEQLPTHDKQLVVVPEGGDYGSLQNSRHRMVQVIAEFLAG